METPCQFASNGHYGEVLLIGTWSSVQVIEPEQLLLQKKYFESIWDDQKVDLRL